MKTPSSLLLLVLFAAMPAAAQRVPPQRCDDKWLEATQATMSKPGGAVSDARVYVSNNAVKLMALKPETCDAGTWLQLGKGEIVPDGSRALFGFRNPAVSKFWDNAPIDRQIGLILVVSDFYKALDPKIAEVLAAGEEVIAAAADIGLVVAADAPKAHLDFLKANSGGAMAAAAPKLVSFTVPDDKKSGTVIPADVDKTWRKLLDEKGEVNAGGQSILRFRMAVLALGVEIVKQGKSSEAVKRRIGNDAKGEPLLPGVNDFTTGLSGFSSPKADQRSASDDAAFAKAVRAMTGEGTAAMDTADLRVNSILDTVDLGLRNFIAVRAEQIDKIVVAARGRLNGKTITAIAVAARAGADARTAKNPLGEAAMKSLGETAEYQKLDALYTKISGQAKTPANDAALQSIEEQRNEMRAAALSATVQADPATGRKEVVFTQGNRPAVLGSFVPPVEGKEGDADRASVGDVIAGLIVDRAKGNPRYQGLVAAIGGKDPSAPPTAPEEVAVSKDVPPEIAPVKKEAAGCEKPKDIISNDHEKYASRQRAAAAEKVTDNQRVRAKLTSESTAKLAEAETECKRDRAEAARTKDGDFSSGGANARNRANAVGEADKRCEAAKKKIAEDLTAALDKVKVEDAAKAADNINVEANKVLAASFRKSIEVSVASLRHEYLTADSSRQNKLIREAKLSGPSSSLDGFVKLWFNKNWPPEPETTANPKPAVTACASALGLDDKDKSPSYRNPENPDKIAEYCKVHEDLVKFVVDWKGKVD